MTDKKGRKRVRGNAGLRYKMVPMKEFLAVESLVHPPKP